MISVIKIYLVIHMIVQIRSRNRKEQPQQMKYSVTCFFYQLHNIILKPSTSTQNRQTILYIIIIRSICQLFFPRKADQPPAIMFIFFPSSHLSVLPCFSPSFHLSIYLSCFFLASFLLSLLCLPFTLITLSYSPSIFAAPDHGDR